MKRSAIFLVTLSSVLSILTFSSCEKDNDSNESPIVEEQTFTIKENSPQGTIVDTVLALDKDGDALRYEITSGNSNNTFIINPCNGILKVNNPEFLDYESSSSFELEISVTDSSKNPHKVISSAIINLIDVEPTSNGLFAFYEFQNNVNDHAGIYNGTEYNLSYSPFLTGSTNITGKFNGLDSYVVLPHNFDFKCRTINLWFKVVVINEDYEIIYSSDNPDLFYGLSIITVKKENTNKLLYFSISGQLVSTAISENTWYNACIIADNGVYSYYLNGSLIESGRISSYTSSYNGSSYAVIGCLRTLDQRFFNGFVDDLRIYNRALTPDEIKIIYLEH